MPDGKPALTSGETAIISVGGLRAMAVEKLSELKETQSID